MRDFSYNIAIVIPDMMNQFFSELAQQVQRCFFSANVGSIILTSDGRRDIELRHLALARSIGVDGIVFVSVGDHVTVYEMLSSMGLPYVVLDREVPESAGCDFVISDNVHGTRLIVDFLIERGHRDIAYVAGDQATEPGRVRRETIVSYGKEQGLYLAEGMVFNGDFSFKSGYEVARGFLANRNKESVVVCANDFMAIGFLQALKERSVRVPQDIGIIGYDDIPLAAWVFPRLTTIRQEIPLMAQYAAELLVSRIGSKCTTPNEHAMPRLKAVPPRLVVRESCDSFRQLAVP